MIKIKTISQVLFLLVVPLTFGPVYAQDSDDEEDGPLGCDAVGATVGVVASEVLSDQVVDTLGGRIAAGLTSVFLGWGAHEICDDIDAAAEEAFEEVAYAWGLNIVPFHPSLPGHDGTPWCLHVNESACDPFSEDETFQNLLDAWSIVDTGLDNLRFGGADSSFAVFTENSFRSAFNSAVLSYEAQTGFVSTTTGNIGSD